MLRHLSTSAAIPLPTPHMSLLLTRTSLRSTYSRCTVIRLQHHSCSAATNKCLRQSFSSSSSASIRRFHTSSLLRHGVHKRRNDSKKKEEDEDDEDDHDHDHDHEHDHKHKEEGKLKHEHDHEHEHDHDHTHVKGKQVKSQPSTSIVSRIRGILNHYKLGIKLLWRNTQRAREIRASGLTGPKQTYTDSQHMLRVRHDLSIGVPFVAFFVMPIVGNFAPLLAHFFPRYLPTTFYTPAHIQTFMKADAKESREVVHGLVEFYSLQSKSCGLITLREMLSSIEKDQGRLNIGDMLPLREIIQDISPDFYNQFDRPHLLHLHRALTHSSFIARLFYPKRLLYSSLLRWHARTWEADQSIVRSGGVAKLTQPQIVQALYDRGIYMYPNCMAYVLMKQQEAELQTVDSSKKDKPKADDDTHLYSHHNIPTQAIIDEWRRGLSDWLHLHTQLQLEARNTLNRQQQHHNKLSDSASKPAATHSAAAPATVVPTSPSSSSSSSPSAFSTFLIHVPALARRQRHRHKHKTREHEHGHEEQGKKQQAKH